MLRESNPKYEEMSVADFYARLADVKAKGGEMPKTSQPSPNDFAQAYNALIKDGAKHIISIRVTAKSSGTVNRKSLRAAAQSRGRGIRRALYRRHVSARDANQR